MKTDPFWFCVRVHYHPRIWECWQQNAGYSKNFLVEDVDVFINSYLNIEYHNMAAGTTLILDCRKAVRTLVFFSGSPNINRLFVENNVNNVSSNHTTFFQIINCQGFIMVPQFLSQLIVCYGFKGFLNCSPFFNVKSAKLSP